MARPTMKLYNKLLGTLAVGIGSVWALENTTVYEFESVKGLFEQDYRSVFSDNGSRVQLRDAVVMNGTVVYEASGDAGWNNGLLEDWLQEQRNVSVERVLDNIGPSGPHPSVLPGVVIASPSQAHPDYFYQWIRDSALTINSIVSHSPGLGRPRTRCCST